MPKPAYKLIKNFDYGPFVPERIHDWAYWIVERESIRKLKSAGVPPPYTDDPIMEETRWCNVRRMDDKVSIWMLRNWYRQNGYHNASNAIVAGLLARMINRTETLRRISGHGRFVTYDHDHTYAKMYEVKAEGTPVFTNAYIINGASGGPKIDQVLNAIRTAHEAMGGRQNAAPYLHPASLQRTAEALQVLPGVGSFIAGQVVADLRHVLGDVADGWWADRMTWAPPGPGSSRGMKYLLGMGSVEDTIGRGKDMPEKQFLPALRQLIDLAQRHPTVGPVFAERALEAHDIQNTLCETSKFIRISYTEGRAKNKYDAMNNYHAQQKLEI